MRTQAKEAYAALKSLFRYAAPDSVLCVPFGRMVEALIVLSKVQDASKTGKWFRSPKDHAPVFSLFTFFGLGH
jgi:hypothetical protein